MNITTQYALSSIAKSQSTTNQLIHIQNKHSEEYNLTLQRSTEKNMSTITSYLSTQPEVSLQLIFNIEFILIFF